MKIDMQLNERVALWTRLFPLAVAAMEGGDDLTATAHGDIQHEYLRGQAELICEAVGLHMDHKMAVMWLIAHFAGLDVKYRGS